MAMATLRRNDFVMPENPSVQDLVMAINKEREAREAAMADQQKHLDWRFVHFTEEFKLRIEQVEQRMEGQSMEEPNHFAHGSHGAPRGFEASDSQRLHEGKVAFLEARLHEVQSWSNKLEARLEQMQTQQMQQLQEIQAWLNRADLRLSGLEVRIGRHANLQTSERTSPASSATGTPAGLKVSQRLVHVERACLERPEEADICQSATPISQSHRGYSGDSGASTCSTTGRSGVQVLRERTAGQPHEGNYHRKVAWPMMVPPQQMR
eukprot:CAMPEP_0114676382 /NCGR_PEP_ID=MMETSP0191-20121206/49158_1 /TAXON_ID=126664 /ORGANISM="Sorites sp." /LENGTH=264 /DNA_ID=CAMNT_0001947281 /DNA_START=16 /DNA_END=810 /DNA_ORIENTATION=-